MTGTGYDAPLALDGGDVDTSGALSSHFRVYRAQVVHNTFVDNDSGIEVGKNYSLPPADCVIADNIVAGTRGSLFSEWKAPVGMRYQGNIAHPAGTAVVGIMRPPAEVRVVDPLFAPAGGAFRRIAAGSPAVDAALGSYAFLVDDIEGQPRVAPDVGADELAPSPPSRRPLTTTDVGPDAP